MKMSEIDEYATQSAVPLCTSVLVHTSFNFYLSGLGWNEERVKSLDRNDLNSCYQEMASYLFEKRHTKLFWTIVSNLCS